MAEDEEEKQYDMAQNEAIYFNAGSPSDCDYNSLGHMTPSESITSLQLMLTTIKQERNSDGGHKMVTEGKSFILANANSFFGEFIL